MAQQKAHTFRGGEAEAQELVVLLGVRDGRDVLQVLELKGVDGSTLAAAPARGGLVREGERDADDDAGVHGDLHRGDGLPVSEFIFICGIMVDHTPA